VIVRRKIEPLTASCILRLALTGLLLLVLPAAVAADEPEAEEKKSDWVKTIEVGAGYIDFSDDYEDGNGQFVRFTLDKPWKHLFRVEVGQAERFDLDGTGFGLFYQYTFPSRISVSVGAAGGSGKLSPEHRFDAGVTFPLLAEKNLLLQLGFKDEKSRFENSAQGVSLGTVYYFGQWMATGNVRYDRGDPGDTDSWGTGASLTWYIYKKLYLGAGIDYGETSYVIVGPGQVEVDLKGRSYNLGVSYWINDHSGLNARLDYGSNSIYSGWGTQVSYFWQWQ
jgi:YaiO family outer membrane protein